MKQRSDQLSALSAIALISAGLVLAVLLVEGALQLHYRFATGEWRWAHKPPESNHVFQWHPYLVGVPRPGVTGKSGTKTVTINALGFRGPEVDLKKRPGVLRVVTLGGSSTFGTTVSDDDAWPRQLEHRLGSGFEVINLGVPGYGTVENLIQTAFMLSDLDPDIAIYYEGWNDLRNMHVRPLAPDYSDFHGKQQLTNLDIISNENNTRVAILYYLRNWIFGSTLAQMNAEPSIDGSKDKLTDRIDPRALSLYSRNLQSIVAVCRSQGIRPILVPHLLNYGVLTSNEPYFWIPYVKTKDLQKAMGAYNETMRSAARELSVDFVEDVLQSPFNGMDFSDEGHFNEQGSRKFADVLSRYLLAHESAKPGTGSAR